MQSNLSVLWFLQNMTFLWLVFSVYTKAVIVHVVWGEALCQKVKVTAAAAAT